MKGVMTEEQSNNDEPNTNDAPTDAPEDTGDNTGDNTGDDTGDDNTEGKIEDVEPTSFDYDLISDDPKGDDDQYETGDKKGTKAVNAINQMRVDAQVSTSINDFFDKNPEAAQYKSMVKKFVGHAERMKFIKNGLPVSAVIAEALAPHQQRIGAMKVKAADAAANKTRDGGSTPAPKTSNHDFSKMTNSQIAKLSRDVISGRYKA